MKFEMTHPYNVGLKNLLDVFFDKEHVLEKNARLGSRNVRVVELTHDESSAKLVVEREMTTSAKVPGVLASFHREWNRIRQEEHWFQKNDDEWHCEFRVRIEGVPAKIKGMMKLQGDDTACTNQVSMDVRCDVPLLGKKIAKFLADDSQVKIQQEYKTIKELL